MSLNHNSPTKVPVSLPRFDELPHYKDFAGCAWNVWPEDDELGTINLLTQEVVLRAANEEIRLVSGILDSLVVQCSLPSSTNHYRTGKHISLNW